MTKELEQRLSKLEKRIKQTSDNLDHLKDIIGYATQFQNKYQEIYQEAYLVITSDGEEYLCKNWEDAKELMELLHTDTVFKL